MAPAAEALKNPPKSNLLEIAFLTLVYTFIIFPVVLSTLIIWLPFRTLIIAAMRRLNPEIELVEKGFGTLIAIKSTRKCPDGNLLYHLICQGSVPLDQLRHQFYQKVLLFKDPNGNEMYRRLRYFIKPICGVLFLREDVSFDLENHIRLYDSNEPGLDLPRDCVTEDDLMKVTGRLASRAYPEGRSPWELLLIQNFKSKSDEDFTAMTLRIHHVIADGQSGINLIHLLFGAPAPAPSAPQLTVKDEVFRAIYVTLKAPYELARYAVDFHDEFNAWKLPAKSYSDDHVSLCSDLIKWSKIQRIMNKYEVNSNAAIYSIIGGAIVRMMKEVGQDVPHKLSTVISYHLPNQPDGLCSNVSYSAFQFYPNIHFGRALVQKVGIQVKTVESLNPLAMVLNATFKLQSLLPVFIAKNLLAYPTTLGFIHFPGPLSKLHDSNFATLVDIIPAAVPVGLGSIVLAMSMAGNLRIGLTVNTAVLPGQDDYSSFARHVQDEMQTYL